MKKLSFTVLAVLLGSGLFAQDKPSVDRQLKLGLISVSQISWMTIESNNLSSGGVKAGVNLGISGDYYFTENYALSVELLHSTTGFKVKADSISYKGTAFGNVGIDYRIRSFQLPISIKLRTNEIGYWRYYGQIGIAPSLAYRKIKADYDKPIFQTIDESKGRFVNEFKNDFDGTDQNKNLNHFLEEDNVSYFNVPIMVSAGAEWGISGNAALIMGLRYEYGLNNLMRANDTQASRSCLGLLIGFRF